MGDPVKWSSKGQGYFENDETVIQPLLYTMLHKIIIINYCSVYKSFIEFTMYRVKCHLRRFNLH